VFIRFDIFYQPCHLTLDAKYSRPRMAKRKRRTDRLPTTNEASMPNIENASLSSIPATTTGIAADSMLGYKIRVLIYDFLHVAKGLNSLRRIKSTLDEHYISTPYFSDTEATAIKCAIVDVSITGKLGAFGIGTTYVGMEGEGATHPDQPDSNVEGQTFDVAIRALLNNFIDKRRASSDARPCG
jgi:hypothetical protein